MPVRRHLLPVYHHNLLQEVWCRTNIINMQLNGDYHHNLLQEVWCRTNKYAPVW